MRNKLFSFIQWLLSRSLRTKIILVLILIGILAFSGYTIVAGSSQKTTYQTTTAEKGTLVTSVTTSGNVASANSASITTSATGIVTQVYVQNGDEVEEGDKIADIKLDKSGQQKQAAAYASLLAAQNTLNAANAKLNSLQSALFTANQKFVNGAGTADPIEDDPTYIIQRADWLQAEADYTNQQGVIAQAQASLTSAQLLYAQTSGTITAPMSGKISNLSLNEGLLLASSTTNSSTTSDSSSTTSTSSYGTVVLEGGQPQVSVNVSEVDVPNIKVGQKVTMTMDAFADKTFTGKVTAIDTNGTVSSGVTTYSTTITFDDAPDTIYPNMAVSATIITNVKNDVLLIPYAAVQTSNGSSTVRIMNNGAVTQVEVSTGLSNDTQIEILSGINEGDTIVTSTVSTSTTTTSSSTSSPFGTSGFGIGGGMMRTTTNQRSTTQK